MSLTIEVPPDLEELLRKRAEEQGEEVSEFVRRVLEDLVQDDGSPERVPDARPSYLAGFIEEAEALPDDVVDRLPTDGSVNLDHYLYGAPKKQP